MADLLPDNIDFAAYLDETECATKVVPASEYEGEVLALLNRSPAARLGRMMPWANTHDKIEFRSHEVSLWTGYNGDGKSLMLGQIMLSLMAQGARCCIASMEMAPARTLFRMCRQSGTTKDLDGDYIRQFHGYTNGKLWLYNHRGTVDTKAIAGAIRYAADKLDIKHFVVDSLMKCGIAEDGAGALTAQKNFLDLICTIAHDTGIHIHLVAHAKKPEDDHSIPGKYAIAGSAMISNQADNVFSVWRNRRKEEVAAGSYAPRKGESMDDVLREPDALLTCAKQRNGDWEGRVKLWFHADSTQFLNSEYAETMTLLAVGE